MSYSILRVFYAALIAGMILTFYSCGINKEARALRALQSCEYQLAGLDSLVLAGVDMKAMLQDANRGSLDLSGVPALSMGFLTGRLPLTANLQLEIHNPTAHLAGVGQFEYIVLLDHVELLNGTSDLPISVPARSTVVSPIQLQANVYPLLSRSDNLDRVLDFLSGKESPTGETLDFTFKFKPTLTLAGKTIQYPGYITVEKSLDAASLRRMTF